MAGMVAVLPLRVWAWQCDCKEDWLIDVPVHYDVEADMVFEGRITQSREKDAASYYVEPQKIYKGNPEAEWYDLSDAIACRTPQPHPGDIYLFYMSILKDKNKKPVLYTYGCGGTKPIQKITKEEQDRLNNYITRSK